MDEGLLSMESYRACELCPRRCRRDRAAGELGACHEAARPRVARAALHLWEEPPISGTAADETVPEELRDKGSGTIFFSGCPLGCVYCQNIAISRGGVGAEVGVDELAAMMLDLQAQGALNVNLVTALHFAPSVAAAIDRARTEGLTVPIVCNTSGYERAGLVRALASRVDVWLTDYKYRDGGLAARLSRARDYAEVADRALLAMVEGVAERGGRREDAHGHLQAGVVVRHLVLPGHEDDSYGVVEHVRGLVGTQVDLSIMSQYTPNAPCRERGGELAGTVDAQAYGDLVDYAQELGFERVWWQEGSAVGESFVPAFDGTGVPGAALGPPPEPRPEGRWV